VKRVDPDMSSWSTSSSPGALIDKASDQLVVLLWSRDTSAAPHAIVTLSQAAGSILARDEYPFGDATDMTKFNYKSVNMLHTTGHIFFVTEYFQESSRSTVEAGTRNLAVIGFDTTAKSF